MRSLIIPKRQWTLKLEVPDGNQDCLFLALLPWEGHLIFLSPSFLVSKQILIPPSWCRQWHPTPVLLPGKSHGRRSLVGPKPWGHKELDMTERLTFSAAAAKLLQSCPTLCDPRDGSPPVSAIPGILQARTPEGVAISFSSA